MLAAGGPEGAFLLTEQKSKSAMSFSLAAIQIGPSQVAVEFIGQKAAQNEVAGMSMLLHQDPLAYVLHYYQSS